eukprot:tig00000823_g4552.t1
MGTTWSHQCYCRYGRGTPNDMGKTLSGMDCKLRCWVTGQTFVGVSQLDAAEQTVAEGADGEAPDAMLEPDGSAMESAAQEWGGDPADFVAADQALPSSMQIV